MLEPDDELVARAQARVGMVFRDKYRIDRILGIGGMAAVYAAQHRNGRRVALKVLNAELSIREDMRRRFRREGHAANAVNHPGAVVVIDDDVAEDGSAFLVMELLDGEVVEELWEQNGRRLPLGMVLAIGRELCEVLAAAHRAGIVHRDLKPENLFLTNEGCLKVLDFGLAHLRDVARPKETTTGMVFGTPAFMPPEQANGHTTEIDARSDLWAVGATMFTLLSGATVHEAQTAQQFVILAATKPARSLATVMPNAAPPLVALVDRALSVDKKARWRSAEDMRTAICLASNVLVGVAEPDLVGPQELTRVGGFRPFPAGLLEPKPLASPVSPVRKPKSDDTITKETPVRSERGAPSTERAEPPVETASEPDETTKRRALTASALRAASGALNATHTITEERTLPGSTKVVIADATPVDDVWSEEDETTRSKIAAGAKDFEATARDGELPAFQELTEIVATSRAAKPDSTTDPMAPRPADKPSSSSPLPAAVASERWRSLLNVLEPGEEDDALTVVKRESADFAITKGNDQLRASTPLDLPTGLARGHDPQQRHASPRLTSSARSQASGSTIGMPTLPFEPLDQRIVARVRAMWRSHGVALVGAQRHWRVIVAGIGVGVLSFTLALLLLFTRYRNDRTSSPLEAAEAGVHSAGEPATPVATAEASATEATDGVAVGLLPEAQAPLSEVADAEATPSAASTATPSPDPTPDPRAIMNEATSPATLPNPYPTHEATSPTVPVRPAAPTAPPTISVQLTAQPPTATPTSREAPPQKPNCNPPYDTDRTGIRHWKLGCL